MKFTSILLGALSLSNFAFAFALRIRNTGDAIDESKWATEDIPVEHDPELAKYFERVDSAPEAWEARPINF